MRLVAGEERCFADGDHLWPPNLKLPCVHGGTGGSAGAVKDRLCYSSVSYGFFHGLTKPSKGPGSKTSNLGAIGSYQANEGGPPDGTDTIGDRFDHKRILMAVALCPMPADVSIEPIREPGRIA